MAKSDFGSKQELQEYLAGLKQIDAQYKILNAEAKKLRDTPGGAKQQVQQQLRDLRIQSDTHKEILASIKLATKELNDFEKTQEKSIDINLKAYKNLDFGVLWGGLSYRRSFDGAQYQVGSGVSSQNLQYITPILGLNFNKFMFAYTYSHLSGAIKFDNGGYHQITLGVNLFCKREKYECNCPAIN